MTTQQAILELEDRGTPEVIEFIKELDAQAKAKDSTIAELQAKISELKFGMF